MYIDGVKFCNVLEDTDRGLTQDMSIEDIQKAKVYGKTAIPTGTYKVTLDIVSLSLVNINNTNSVMVNYLDYQIHLVSMVY